MKYVNRKNVKKIVAICMSIALVVGGVSAYVIFEKKSSADNSKSAYEKVIDAFNKKRTEVNASNSELKIKEQDPDKEERYIIQLKDEAAVDKVNNVQKQDDTDVLVGYEKKVLSEQKGLIAEVERITGNKIEGQTGFLINSVTIEATQKEVEDISKLDEVEEVYEAVEYKIEDVSNTLNYTLDDYKMVSGFYDKSTGLDKLKEDENTKYTGVSTVVAVVDTGVNPEHQDMKLDDGVTPKFSKSEWEDKIRALGHGKYVSEKVPFGYNYVYNDNNIFANKDNHGYHVSGITAGNGKIDGVAPNTQIVGLKAIGNLGATTDQLVRAIEDAVKLDVDVINMSLGRDFGVVSEDDLESKAVKKATESGVVCCIAAGNEATADGRSSITNYMNMVDTATISSPGTSKTALTVAASSVYMNNGEINIEMARFSSWGPSNELNIKPEITAPGCNIHAAVGGKDKYETKDGTSMATPYIAGCSALMINDIKKDEIKSIDNNKVLAGNELSLYVKNNLMNTSEIITDTSNSGLPYSVRVQGAGMVNINSAVNNKVIATCNNEAKIELGEIIGSRTVDIVLTNYGDKDATYTLSASDVYIPDTRSEGNIYCIKKASGASINASGTVTVPARGRKNVKITVNSNLSEQTFIEGYITFKGEGVPNLNVPMLGFNGDWSTEPAIDKSIYDEGESYLEQRKVQYSFSKEQMKSATCIMGMNSTYTDVALGKVGVGANGYIYNGEMNMFSPNNDMIMDEVYPGITQLRSLYEIKLNILDKDMKKIRGVGTVYDIRRGIWQGMETLKSLNTCGACIFGTPMKWDGKIYDQDKEKYVMASDGQYYMQIEYKISEKEDAQFINMPIKIDTVKPHIIDSTIESKDNGYNYSFNVRDNLALDDYMYVYIDGEVKEYELSKLGNIKGQGLLNIEASKEQQVYVLFSDVAGNPVIENIANMIDEQEKQNNNQEYKEPVEDNFKAKFRLNERDVADYSTVQGDTVLYVLLNEDNKEEFEFDIVCDEEHKIVEGSLSAYRTNVSGIDDMSEMGDISDGMISLEGTRNNDGSVHIKLDRSLDWSFINYQVVSDTTSVQTGLIQIFNYSDSERYYEQLAYEDCNMFTEITGKVLTSDKLNENGEYVYKGKLNIKPTIFTINGQQVNVNEKNEFQYNIQTFKGKNTLKCYLKNQYIEQENSIEFYVNDMIVDLDIDNSQKIVTDFKDFNISGSITSYITGYYITINGDNVYTDKGFIEIDGKLYDPDVKKFSYNVPLKEGENKIKLKIANKKQQVVEKTFVVVYKN